MGQLLMVTAVWEKGREDPAVVSAVVWEGAVRSPGPLTFTAPQTLNPCCPLNAPSNPVFHCFQR